MAWHVMYVRSMRSNVHACTTPVIVPVCIRTPISNDLSVIHSSLHFSAHSDSNSRTCTADVRNRQGNWETHGGPMYGYDWRNILEG